MTFGERDELFENAQAAPTELFEEGDLRFDHGDTAGALLDDGREEARDGGRGVLGGRIARSNAELRGQELFFGKAQCSTCHPAPYYTDGSMHNLRTERFFEPVLVNGRMASQDGPIKTFPLRGLKDSPPYLHDGRLLTIEDTVEFFNLVLGTKLTAAEKTDLATFLKAL